MALHASGTRPKLARELLNIAALLPLWRLGLAEWSKRSAGKCTDEARFDPASAHLSLPKSRRFV